MVALDAELLLVDELEVDDDEPMRLVDAFRAEDMLPELPAADEEVLAFELEALELTVALWVVLDELEALARSRPKPDRLPRICGLMIAEKFSAAVTPVSRTVAERMPELTVAVRTAEIADGVARFEAARFDNSQNAPAPTINKAPRIHIQRPVE